MLVNLKPKSKNPFLVKDNSLDGFTEFGVYFNEDDFVGNMFERFTGVWVFDTHDSIYTSLLGVNDNKHLYLKNNSDVIYNILDVDLYDNIISN